MYVDNEYKQGVIYSQKDLTVYFKGRYNLNCQDEVIYNSLKEIAKLLEDKEVNIKIVYCQDKILDEKPENIEEPEKGTEDIEIILNKFEYKIKNMIYKDQDIYGINLDGNDRKCRLIWADENGTEHFVPLDKIDSFKAENPNGAYSYNSETHELIFESISSKDTKYIMRRY